MESITSNPSDPRDPQDIPAGHVADVDEAPTQRLPAILTAEQSTESHSVLASSPREQCPACGAAVAADQRYCVDCGQRLASARPVFMNEHSQSRPLPAPEPPRKPRLSLSPNSTLIAGIGTLLLAMGVGVLIGRGGQGANSKHDLTPTILTAPSASSTGASTSTTASTPTTSTSNASAAPKTSAAKSSIPKPTKTAVAPPNPTVKVGQKGTGPGYQHGKFTGNFFGGENEEGEEAGEESEGSSKAGKSGSSSKKSGGSSKGGKH